MNAELALRAAGVGLALLVPAPALAQADGSAGASTDTYLLVVSGIGGAPEYVDLFHGQALGLVDAALARGLPPERIAWLAEDPARLPGRIAGRSTREAVAAEISRLAEQATPADRVLVVLIGHGTADGEHAKLNLPGPDLTADDLAGWLEALRAGSVAIVNTASASGGFLGPLGGRGRVVITATRSAREAERTHFGEFFVAAFTGDGADVDKDGRVSLEEAFDYARTEVERHYEREGQLLTEHAVLEGDEVLAGRFRLGGPGAGDDAARDPRLAALLAEKDRIETAIADLRSRSDDMERSDYETALEDLLVELAGVNARLDGSGTP